MSNTYDAVVVGSGPNGFAAAITLARAGQKVLIVEAKATIGGGMRTAELTQPGFKHDICSAIHPFGVASPFFKQIPLKEHGLEWIHSPSAIAHVLDDGAVIKHQSLDKTAEGLGEDAEAYRFLMAPLVKYWNELAQDILKPIIGIPKHPISLARFGWRALAPAKTLANTFFKTEQAKALFAGIAAHSSLPLSYLGTSAAALMLSSLGHKAGWPLAKGGSQSIANALASYFKSLGGDIQTDFEVQHLQDLPPAKTIMLNVTPKQFLSMTDDLPNPYKRAMNRFCYGAGSFKLDYALSEPVPWKDPSCHTVATVHVGGTLQEIAESEHGLLKGKAPEKPFLITAQHSLFDKTRAPQDKHTFWAYCHVPNGFDGDMTQAIEKQIERFAPGFKDCIIEKNSMRASDLQSYNPNYIGGDINSGAATLWQLAARPTMHPNPYKTPLKGVYLCSSSTPPGGGVHGMGGYNAARAALKDR